MHTGVWWNGIHGGFKYRSFTDESSNLSAPTRAYPNGTGACLRNRWLRLTSSNLVARTLSIRGGKVYTPVSDAGGENSMQVRILSDARTRGVMADASD